MYNFKLDHLHTHLDNNKNLYDIRPSLEVHLITDPEVNDGLGGYLSTVGVDPIDGWLDVEPV